jgi:hypothetical protein
MRRNSAYLVQVRNLGESWHTVGSAAEFHLAARTADLLAAETRDVAFGGQMIAYPVHKFVRVVRHGQVAYDPRAAAREAVSA